MEGAENAEAEGETRAGRGRSKEGQLKREDEETPGRRETKTSIVQEEERRRSKNKMDKMSRMNGIMKGMRMRGNRSRKRMKGACFARPKILPTVGGQGRVELGSKSRETKTSGRQNAAWKWKREDQEKRFR